MQIMPEQVVLPEWTLCGKGVVLKLIPECAGFGARGVLVHGRSLVKSGALEKIMANIPEGVRVVSWEHGGKEPTLDDLQSLLDFARGHDAEWIAAVGGGSVMDVAKAAAGLFHAANSIASYHDGQPIERPGIPFIAAPTTAGTGSEATINAVLTNTAKRQKKSIRNPWLMARLVILDSDLLSFCPKQVIAHAGLDAFTQAVEAYSSRMATWLSDQFGLKAISLIAGNLEAVYRSGTGEERGNLLLGSYLAGLSFSMARLGVVHGLAHPLGIRYHAAHGLVCGVCLPHAIELNRVAMGEKYAIMSRAISADLLDFTRRLLEQLNVASPFAGRQVVDREVIVSETLKSWSTAANPKRVTESDVDFLLARLFGKT